MKIYFDNATTSFPKPEEVIRAIESVLRNIGSSPGRGGVIASRDADRIIFQARENIKDFFNIKNSENVIFTPNATASINLALKGILKSGDHVITSSMEHNAVVRPLKGLEKKGVTLSAIENAQDGSLRLEKIEELIRPSTKMIIIIHASNVIGTISPIRKVGEISRRHKILFLVDAAQTAGHLPINVEKDHIDLLACTGHKSLLGPQGTGFLYIREGINMEPLIEGGTGSVSESEEMPLFLPDRFEAGTQNTAGIAGLSAGLDFIKRVGQSVMRDREAHLISNLIEGLNCIPGVKLYGPTGIHNRVPVISFNIKDKDPAQVGNILNEQYGIVCRVGMHCSSWSHKVIGAFPKGTVRVSIGYFNNEQEIAELLRAVDNISKITT